ncbi:MAG TPA: hypothetical protein VFA85_05690 [Terriglobales bacterium]|nr:hypothetical protein [Terriglobales bacterium]
MKMRLHLFSTILFGLAFFAATATAQTVSWKQIVGIIPAGNVVGSGTGAVTGGFLPWTTTEGAARVDLRDGRIQFVVRGLVFAGGAPGITIGTPAPVTAVNGTLVCDVDGSAGDGNSVLVQTPSVRLTSTGDAFFSGRVGPLPSVCKTQADIAFLIRVTAFGSTTTSSGPWIANGAVLVRGDDMDRDRDGDGH